MFGFRRHVQTVFKDVNRAHSKLWLVHILADAFRFKLLSYLICISLMTNPVEYLVTVTGHLDILLWSVSLDSYLSI